MDVKWPQGHRKSLPYDPSWGQTGRWKSEDVPTSPDRQSKVEEPRGLTPFTKAAFIDAEGTEVENGKILQIFEKR